ACAPWASLRATCVCNPRLAWAKSALGRGGRPGHDGMSWGVTANRSYWSNQALAKADGRASASVVARYVACVLLLRGNRPVHQTRRRIATARRRLRNRTQTEVQQT